MYTVIIFCLSIGIILPVNYSGTNGEKQSRGAGGGGDTPDFKCRGGSKEFLDLNFSIVGFL